MSTVKHGYSRTWVQSNMGTVEHGHSQTPMKYVKIQFLKYMCSTITATFNVIPQA